MKTIRKSRAKESETFADNAVLDLEHGAHLKIQSVKLFPPKFEEETGDLWFSNISARILVVDDRTEDGEDDDQEFTDRFDLKMDLDVLDRLELEDKQLKDAVKSDFTKEQQDALLDPDNWTVRDNTKADKLNTTLFGKKWSEGKIKFHEDLWVDKEFIAKVYPRTGKRSGSYCGWDTFVSLNPPKKKSRLTTAQSEAKAAAESANTAEVDLLSFEDEKLMNDALG